MKKLAVFFPGIGYTVEKPLMYYSRKLAADEGFEVQLLPYTGFPEKVKGDSDRMAKSYQIALAQTREMLSDVDFTAYETILFVGKSIGTIAAAEIAVQYGLHDRVHFVLYTPLEETFRYPLGNAVAFTGSADPWVVRGRIPALCAEKGMACTVVPDANHSLETGDFETDINYLKDVFSKCSPYFIYHQ